MSDWNKLVTDHELNKAKRDKAQKFNFENVNPKLVAEYIENGWEIHSRLKSSIKMKKLKPFDELFENEVWLMLYKQGFKVMNEDRSFKIKYDSKNELTQQIDVFAADDETVLVVECKSTNMKNKKGNFKKEIDAIGGQRQGILKELKKRFPEQKVKLIFATKNYNVSDQDKARMDEHKIEYFDEDKVKYYTELAKHLGHSARYQLLGKLFSGQTIKGIDNVIPAIKGKMGGYDYYSFSVEPETLLKLGYVLHRNDSNKDSMPTYQRIIKKNRLNKIQSFVECGGYFPNSIIINIEGKKPVFEICRQKQSASNAKIGYLHLPQKYKSIYIIDGQHRLYGYSNSEYKNKNTIPVVAFWNMSKEEQVKLFMEINENQKQVPKNLRNTLEEDLKYESENMTEQRKALGIRIARELGEDRNSPLYDRIVVGENQSDEFRCLTFDAFSKAFAQCDYFARFKNNNIVKSGTFDKMSNDKTFDILYPYLIGVFEYLQSELEEYWNVSKKSNDAIVINNAIAGILRLVNDIVNFLIEEKKINPLIDKLDDMLCATKYYLNPFIQYWRNRSENEKQELRKFLGAGGPTKYWRTFQIAINKEYQEFAPDGMLQYIENNSKANNREAQKILSNIELFIKNDVAIRLERFYGNDWLKKGIPSKLYFELLDSANKKNYEEEDESKHVEPWDCMHLINYRDIVLHSSNWSNIFQKSYTEPSHDKSGANKDNKTKWFVRLNKIRNKCFHSHKILKEELVFLRELNGWLVN